jgi:hypothetical protein
MLEILTGFDSSSIKQSSSKVAKKKKGILNLKNFAEEEKIA